MAWYVVHVVTGKEDMVREVMQNQLNIAYYNGEFRLLVPKRKLLERKEGRVNEVYRVMFPGYILVQSNEIYDLVKRTQNCKGVYRYLESEGEFQKVRVEEIAMLLQMTNADGVIEVSEVTIEDGWTQVISGPLQGLEGKIKKVDKRKQRAKVEFFFDGGKRLIDLAICVS